MCGDGLVCGNETCESDADCSGGQVCSNCQCVNPSACASGIAVDKPALRMKASPFTLHLKGQAVIPKPWTGIDPVANGIRVVVDATTGPGGIDVTVPGGAFDGTRGWKANKNGTQWTYIDRSGSVGGVTRAVVKDLSQRTDGLVRWSVRAKSSGGVLPDVTQARMAIVVGAPLECAALQWGGPVDPRPHCTGDAAKLRCR